MKTHMHIIHDKTYPRQANPCRLQGVERSLVRLAGLKFCPYIECLFPSFSLNIKQVLVKHFEDFVSWCFFQYVAPALNSQCHPFFYAKILLDRHCSTFIFWRLPSKIRNNGPFQFLHAVVCCSGHENAWIFNGLKSPCTICLPK